MTIPGSGGQQVKASLYTDDVTVSCLDPQSVRRLMSICNQFKLASGAKKFAKKNTFDHQSIRKWSAHGILKTLQEKESVHPVRQPVPGFRPVPRCLAPPRPVLWARRYGTEPGPGRQARPRKVVVVGIPNPFIWARTKMYFFLIRAYFDQDFTFEEFSAGARQ
eukprot:g44347.t1